MATLALLTLANFLSEESRFIWVLRLRAISTTVWLIAPWWRSRSSWWAGSPASGPVGAEQSDRELPDHFRWQEQEVNATLAMLICALLVALIAVVDYFSPANFNLAILYPIPLFIAAWTGSRRLLWSMLATLLLLTLVAHLWVRQPSSTRNN